MRIYCLRHVAFEGPGVISDWAAKCDHELIEVCVFNNDPFPDIGLVDALVIMGGPMSAYYDLEWLDREKTFIGKALVKDVPILGICLGAQLLADVLGARVYAHAFKEIGWLPVLKTKEGLNSELLADWPEAWTTFHWHGDTFDLPDGAMHLIRSEACENQAFQYGKAVGLQFHMEMTEEGIADVSDRCSHEFVEAPFIQPREALSGSPHMKQNHQLLSSFLDRWLSIDSST